MTKEDLEKILSSMPADTKIKIQDDIKVYEIEAIGLQSKELFLIIGDGNILDLAGLAEMGVQVIGPRYVDEVENADLILGPLDFLAAGLDPLPEPEPIKKRLNYGFDKKVIGRMAKTVVCKNFPNRNLGLIRGKGGKKK
jgi:hypothetical protein